MRPQGRTKGASAKLRALQSSQRISPWCHPQHSASLTALQPAPVAGFGMSECLGRFKNVEGGVEGGVELGVELGVEG